MVGARAAISRRRWCRNSSVTSPHSREVANGWHPSARRVLTRHFGRAAKRRARGRSRAVCPTSSSPGPGDEERGQPAAAHASQPETRAGRRRHSESGHAGMDGVGPGAGCPSASGCRPDTAAARSMSSRCTPDTGPALCRCRYDARRAQEADEPIMDSAARDYPGGGLRVSDADRDRALSELSRGLAGRPDHG